MRKIGALLVASALVGSSVVVRAMPKLPHPAPRATGWTDAGLAPIRGFTLGPIEDALHPGVGYGSEACGRALDLAVDMGATWVAITPFGRMWSAQTADVDLSFEVPFAENAIAVGRAIDQAHARGLRVMLVPHLWLVRGGWRGEIEPFSSIDSAKGAPRPRATVESFRRFTASYRAFLLAWTDVAVAHEVDMLSVGVELRSWATSARAIDDLHALVAEVRGRFDGLLTYSANWDDVGDVLAIDDLDVIGVNAFYPLAEHGGATHEELMEGGVHVGAIVDALSSDFHKPVIFTEVGYTARPDPAIRPWEWPDSMRGVPVDEVAQAEAYRAILAGAIARPTFAGFFVWRGFTDPDDVSQEDDWGFPIRGKLAELVVRDAFSTRWAADGWAPSWSVLGLGAHGPPGASWRFPTTPEPPVARWPMRAYLLPR